MFLPSVIQILCAGFVAWFSLLFIRLLTTSSPLNNVPGLGPKSASFVTGHLARLMDHKTGWDFYNTLSRDYGRVATFNGLFGSKMLFVFDPKAMHSIIVKDHDIYVETEHIMETNRLVFGHGLVSSVGKDHKRQRKMLAPAFSAMSIREMCPIFYQIGNRLKDALHARIKDETLEMNISDWMSRTSLELIGQTGLGYSFDPLTEDINTNDYAQSLKSLLPAVLEFSVFHPLLPWLVKLGSPAFRRQVLDMLPWPQLHRLRNLVDSVEKNSKKVLAEKKRAILSGDADVSIRVGEGKDIMSILLKANMKASESERLTEYEVVSQLAVLTFTATDTTSSALSRVLQLLAEYPHVQTKLRKELVEARENAGGQDIPYDDLVNLPYLEAVCRETLRLYSPAPFMGRTTAKDGVLPLSSPVMGVDGKPMHEIHVPKNTTIIVGLLASNRDPLIWGADCLEWKPERWLSPLPASVTEARLPGVYPNLMTFSAGSRACIGFKFSQTEMKVILALMVESFKFSLPKEKEIEWNFDVVVFPNVRGEKGPARMPLGVSLA